MDEMNEWQPVRLNRATPGEALHTKPECVSKFKFKTSEIAGKIIRVRPDRNPGYHGAYICNPQMIYEIHPEDAVKICGYVGNGKARICEHQILAD